MSSELERDGGVDHDHRLDDAACAAGQATGVADWAGRDCVRALGTGEAFTWSVGSAAGAALPGVGAVNGWIDMNTKAIALTTRTITGGRNNIGCRRAAAAPIRAFVRTRSAAIARAMAGRGSAGPWPMRALLRTRVSAARRCANVSPGWR